MDSTYRDQITPQAMANLFQLEIKIILSLRPEAQTIIFPQHSAPVAQFTLDHFAESNGMHYVCLDSFNLVSELENRFEPFSNVDKHD